MHRKTHNPFSTLFPFVNEVINDVVHAPLKDIASEKPLQKMTAKANVKSFENRFVIEIALPGYKKEDIKVTIEDSVLKVTGNAASTPTTEYKHQEWSVGDFDRSFRLPKEADINSMSAHMIDGILKLEINKLEEYKKSIDVK